MSTYNTLPTIQEVIERRRLKEMNAFLNAPKEDPNFKPNRKTRRVTEALYRRAERKAAKSK